MVKNTLNYVHETFGESLIQVNITFPTSNEAILVCRTVILLFYHDKWS